MDKNQKNKKALDKRVLLGKMDLTKVCEEVKMHNETISDNTMSIMVKIGKAIEKGVGEDIRTYLANNNNAVNNAIAFLRGDYIVTNIRNTVESESVEIKYFKRSSWTGCIVLDRTDKHSYSVCARKTLERIPKNMIRRSPHFLQTILNIENKDEKAVGRQMSLADFGFSVENQFTEEEYEKDFLAIMEEALSPAEGYRHWVITYEAEHNSLVGLSAVLLDGEFGVVKEISLMEMMKPDFGSLTSVETKDDKEKDAHSLVSVKPGLVGRKASEKEQHTEIMLKFVEESKEA